MSEPVLIVGAGLSGLRCASQLAAQGRSVRLLEASDGIGGRARTDEVEGFRLDRGFQVLLTAYPEAQRAFDFGELAIGEFEPGALVRLNGGFSPLVDPVRRPGSLVSAAGSPVIGIADKLRLARMRTELAGMPVTEILQRPDRPAIEALRDRGFTDKAIERFFRPFFGGVLIDPELKSSSRLLEVFFRCFTLGSASLPAGGMGQMANQLARNLPDGTIELGVEVTEVRSDAVKVAGEWIPADAVVVATDERTASKLTGLPEPGPGRATTCVYFDAPSSDIDEGRTLRIGPGPGPINELAIPSSVAPGYAPEGRSLVSVSAVGEEAMRSDIEGEFENQLSEWFGPEVSSWNHLATYRIEDALPDFAPGRFVAGGLDPKLESGVFVCGDYRESPSIQGALVSGRKAATAVLDRS